MPSSKQSKKIKDSQAPRSRSFGGCATCRMRHMKCDEGKPTCLMCQHFGTVCGGYEKNIFFASSSDDDGTERFRRPLFTEAEREQMTVDLVTSIPSKLSLLGMILQLDEECEGVSTHSTNDLTIRKGPFGAFKLARVDSTPSDEQPKNVDSSIVHADILEGCFSPSAFGFSPQTQEFFETFIQNSDAILEISAAVEDTLDLDQSSIEEIFRDESTSPDDVYVGGSSPQPEHDSMDLVPKTSVTLPLSATVRGIESLVPQSAVVLLKHYSISVIELLTPSKNTKTLWHVLFLPHVKSSLAALSMGETLDHASLCIFYGTLAISAFHLKASSGTQTWYDEGSYFKQKAREHIRLALRTAYNIPKVTKYKTLLMALLTMVQVSMFDGDWTQIECYFLEAEKFIRLKGLHRPKSRKRRLLHHCYAFMRLLHESLFAMTTRSLQRMHVQLAVERSGLIIIGQDSPSFRLAPWRNLVQKMLEVKSPDEGENDLHLETPGLFSATMYPEIYGLPEEWLMMLSQVIRLGNQKSLSDGTTSMSLKEFSSRAKDLEQCIINWQRPPAELFCGDHHVQSVDERVLKPLLDALHQALVIYFYRRIYDVDASMLQERVSVVRECLLQCDEADARRVRYTSCFIWPAFIAACEAQNYELQAPFIEWFDDCVTRSGQASFNHMYTIVKKVWHERTQPTGSSVSWVDFMQNTNVIQ